MTTPPGRVMRAISRAARLGSEQIESGSPMATTSMKASAGTAGISTMSATVSVALCSRAPSLGRTCSTMDAELSTNVVGKPLLSSFRPHLPVPQPRSQQAALASRGTCGLTARQVSSSWKAQYGSS